MCLHFILILNDTKSLHLLSLHYDLYNNKANTNEVILCHLILLLNVNYDEVTAKSIKTYLSVPHFFYFYTN